MSEIDTDEPITINYKFKFDDETEKEFKIDLDKNNLDLIQDLRATYPEWTDLDFCKCPHCPFEKEKTLHCPVAKSMIPLIEFCADIVSHEDVRVTIETEERAYMKDTPVHAAISAIVGIYMVTSGCPHMNKLRPMVRFHLPFQSLEESTYRSISMYLVAQYFLHKQGKEADWDLQELSWLFDNVSKVNVSFGNRLREIQSKDSALNAISNLDCFAQSITFSLQDFNDNVFDELGILNSLFKAYID